MAFTIVSDTQSIAATSWWSIQPAAGTQWLITHFANEVQSAVYVALYDGTSMCQVTPASNPGTIVLKLLVNNTTGENSNYAFGYEYSWDWSKAIEPM